ncbi:MAG: peptidylprolyl isomerase [Halothece sp.]
MKPANDFLRNWCKRLLQTSVLALVLVTLSVGLSAAWWDLGNSQSSRESALPQGNAITDPTALLRYALPIDNEPIRRLQQSLEDISQQLRGKRWSPINRDIKTASLVLTTRHDELLADVPEENQPQAEALLNDIDQGLIELRDATEAKDKESIWLKRRELLDKVGEIEELMVTDFPYEVPEEYANLPQLKGRATVKMETEKGDILIVVDGYSAPVTAGNFVDLVQRGFYDGLEFIRAEGFTLQAGDPPGPEEGFIDPNTGEYRAIPLEVLVRGDSEPVYGVTLEEEGRYLDEPVLPFSAYGAVAMARPSDDPNGASSQFFFFLFDTELTPPGFNLMDGRYAIFGYVVEGQDVLEKLTKGDKILSADVIEGTENLVEPKVS